MVELPLPNLVTPLGAYLTERLAHLEAWTHYFLHAEIPILASTAMALEELRLIEDDVDANSLTAFIQSDPLMTLKVMAMVAKLRRPGTTTPTETITTSLVLMGIAPFFRHFGLQLTVEGWLSDQEQALQGLQNLLKRADRAGQFALAFAVHREDTDAQVMHLAAFLHDFAEMLIWIHAPTLANTIQTAQLADPTLRSSVIQRGVLGIEINDLRQSLMKLWHMPELLINISDDRHANHPSVLNVVLAVRLARHTMHGWNNAALPDDIEDIARLLNVSPRAAMSYVRKVDHPV